MNPMIQISEVFDKDKKTFYLEDVDYTCSIFIYGIGVLFRAKYFDNLKYSIIEAVGMKDGINQGIKYIYFFIAISNKRN